MFTGNDLAIDMVMYGSDYLLGLSTFAPEEFARPRSHVGSRRPATSTSCNDVLQYLGAVRVPRAGARVPTRRRDVS